MDMLEFSLWATSHSIIWVGIIVLFLTVIAIFRIYFLTAGDEVDEDRYSELRNKANLFMTMEETLGKASEEIGKTGHEMQHEYDTKRHPEDGDWPIDWGIE